MKTVHYKKENYEILGFYDKKNHKTLPVPNKEISDAKWKEAIQKGFNFIDIELGVMSKKDFGTPAEIEKLKIERFEKGIESHIYTFYPMKEQAQDEKWVSSFGTKIKALVAQEKLKTVPSDEILIYDELELNIILLVGSFYQGKTLDEVLFSVPDILKKMMRKLVKIGIKTEWAESIIDEAKLAQSENRKPKYPIYPNFGGA